jgi:hypothetical protein
VAGDDGVTRAGVERRLASLERQAAMLPRGDGVTPEMRAFLRGLNDDQLAAVERFVTLALWPPDAVEEITSAKMLARLSVEQLETSRTSTRR